MLFAGEAPLLSTPARNLTSVLTSSNTLPLLSPHHYRSYRDGFESGHAHGQLHGTFEGRQLGREKGFEIWEEVGFYRGMSTFWRKMIERENSDPDSL